MSAARMGDWFRRKSIPPSDENLNDIKQVFINLPSFQIESISTEDLASLMEGIHVNRSTEQIAMYKAYWEKDFGDRIKLDDFLISAKVMHDTGELARTHAKRLDKDEDGYISVKEFKQLLEVLIKFDPNLGHKTYDEFAANSDKKCDGLVSIDELADWIGKHTKVINGDVYRALGVPPSSFDLGQMKNIFEAMSSYENESISTKDFDNLSIEMNMERSPEQIATIQNYFDTNFEGRLKLDHFLRILAVLHDKGEIAKCLVVATDEHAEGVICHKEFVDILDVMVAYAPEIAGSTYDNILKDADAKNTNGMFSVEELSCLFNKQTEN